MSRDQAELSVTLSPELLQALEDEAQRLGVAIEWLVASLVVDTLEEPAPAADAYELNAAPTEATMAVA